MSCHGKQLGDGAMLWICKPPIMGFTLEDKWIRQELKLFAHNKNETRALKARLQYIAQLTADKEQAE